MVLFKLFAGTDIGLRDNNEDNFTVCPDLTHNEWFLPDNAQAKIQLGELGCIMAVADGMGGQNAGEVASSIAISTIQNIFSSKKLPRNITEKPETIARFLKKVIAEADIKIKMHSKKYPESEGMGSTIVMAWIIGQKAYIAWLGDSRAYSFVPDKGIARLSKDHSFVQQLVDAGKLSEEAALTHPQSNIITRSLGDVSQKAKADVVEHQLSKGEIIMLCTDGLCGSCLDQLIGTIIDKEQKDLQQCKEKLTEAALDAGGSDNITISLFQVVDGVTEIAKSSVEKDSSFDVRKLFSPMNIILIVFGLLVLFGLCYSGYSLFSKEVENKVEKTEVLPKDSTDSEKHKRSEKEVGSRHDTSDPINIFYKKIEGTINLEGGSDSGAEDEPDDDLNESSVDGQGTVNQTK